MQLAPGNIMKHLETALKDFFAKHATETFYAAAIDAGYLYLNSEEAFEARRKKSATKWAKSTAIVTLEEARACDPDDLDDMYPTLADYLGSDRSFEAGLEAENASRANTRAAGNPYEQQGSPEWTRLRYRTGNFAYGQLVTLDLDAAYLAHYEADGDAQADTPYAKKARSLIAALEANRSTLFAGAKLGADFRIYDAMHEH